MNFLCDVHISYKLVKAISDLEYKAIHVNDILDKWFTKDADISILGDILPKLRVNYNLN